MGFFLFLVLGFAFLLLFFPSRKKFMFVLTLFWGGPSLTPHYSLLIPHPSLFSPRSSFSPHPSPRSPHPSSLTRPPSPLTPHYSLTKFRGGPLRVKTGFCLFLIFFPSEHLYEILFLFFFQRKKKEKGGGGLSLSSFLFGHNNKSRLTSI